MGKDAMWRLAPVKELQCKHGVLKQSHVIYRKELYDIQKEPLVCY